LEDRGGREVVERAREVEGLQEPRRGGVFFFRASPAASAAAAAAAAAALPLASFRVKSSMSSWRVSPCSVFQTRGMRFRGTPCGGIEEGVETKG